MENKLINVNYDKFTSKTTSVMKYDYYWNDCFNMNFRFISMPGHDSLFLDLQWSGNEWFFLRAGNLIILINDVESIVLEPNESYAETTEREELLFDDKNYTCDESDFYEIDQSILKKICDAKSLEIKITGKSRSVCFSANDGVIKELNVGELYDGKVLTQELCSTRCSFIDYAKSFYNEVYDNDYMETSNMLAQSISNTYQKYLKDDAEAEKAANRQCGCMVFIAVIIIIAIIIIGIWFIKQLTK